MGIVQANIDSQDWKGTAAVVLMLIAGIVHFIIIPQQMEHALAHGIAMGIIGVLEVLWAIIYRYKPSRVMAQIGAVLAISMIILWAITRVAPAPFTNQPEEIDFAGVASKILEALSAVALLVIVVGSAHSGSPQRQPAHVTILTILLVSVVLTVAGYELSRASQPLFPQLGTPEMQNMNMP